MKILLDENLPRQLKADFGSEFEVWTVRDMGWLGKKNGELSGLVVFNVNLGLILLTINHLLLFRCAKGFGFFALRKWGIVALKNSHCLSSPEGLRVCEF